MDLKEILGSVEANGEKSKYSLRAVDEIEEEIRADLLRMLERGAKSSGELRKKLLEKSHPQDVVELLISRFVEVGLIDDYAAAKDAASYLFARKSKAKIVIARELREKGFPKDAIDLALESIDSADELEAAKQIAVSRLARMGKLEESVAERRLAGYLGRKGYSSQVIWEAVRFASQQLTN
ncbi:MAG: regulatory protein RecX [Rhodoluna sp.]